MINRLIRSISARPRSRLSPVWYGVLLALVLLMSVASVVFAYTYRAAYTITSTSSTSYTMLPVSTSVNSTYLVSRGFMGSTGLDSRVETIGGLVKPHMVASDRVLAAVAVPASSQTNLYFTTGSSNLTSMPIITGYGGNVTSPVSATYNTGTGVAQIQWTGYLDPSAVGGNLMEFATAGPFYQKVYVSAAGSIRAVSNVGAPNDYDMTVAGNTAGLQTVTLSTNGTVFSLVVGSNTTSQAFTGAMIVVANAGAYSHTWLNNNVMPYCSNVTVSVLGVEQIRYEPITIISGTALPDRSGTGNTGTIAWGTMPTGVSVALGGMVSSAQSAPGSISTGATRDIIPETPGSDWSSEPGITTALANHPLRPFIRMVSDNTTLTEAQTWIWSGMAFVIFILITVATRVKGHHLITGVAVAVALIALVVQTIFPWWTILVAAIAVFLGMISERSTNI